MIVKKRKKTNLKKSVLGTFFVLLTLFSAGISLISSFSSADAVPIPENTSENTSETTTETTSDSTSETTETIQATDSTEVVGTTDSTDTTVTETTETTTTETTQPTSGPSASATDGTTTTSGGESCEQALGAVAWTVCPNTGIVSQAVGWLYDRLESILTINPVEAKDGSPIYEIWKYCLTLANFVFIIFVLVIIYSQITGYGINNYGIKKALPKLIVAAVLVNLSFLICSLAVDISNIVGNGVRALFESVEESVAATSNMSMHLSIWDQIMTYLGGGAIAIGATMIAFDAGMMWMLIPVVFGALVSVVAGLITIAMRQAVIVLLIMIAPLAIVGCILPNTEPWFQKWKQLFLRMLIFYPMFSLLFGASSLAGFALITSATDGFGLLLGAAVQTFPLFFAWSLMKMSGTFLETINAKARSIGARPVAASRNFAELQRQASRARHLAGPARTPSLKLMQFMANRRVMTEADLSAHQETVRNRGLAYRANRNYKGGVDRRNAAPTRRGERAYAEQAANMRYQRQILRDQNHLNEGLGGRGATPRQAARLAALDTANINASDYLKTEQARGEKIEFRNAEGFYKRMNEAMEANMDLENGFIKTKNADGNEVLTPRTDYAFRLKTPDANQLAASAAAARYNAVHDIMNGNLADIDYAAAEATLRFKSQAEITSGKVQKYYDMVVPTEDIKIRLSKLTKSPNAISDIDTIVAGLRVLNQRDDKDAVLEQLHNVLDHGVELGTHASQTIGNFLMFEVGGGDPTLRRFGKHLNLETAQVFNNNARTNRILTLEEMVTGQYQQINPVTGQLETKNTRMDIAQLLEGTSFSDISRKAMSNLEDILKMPYTDENGNLDFEAYATKRYAVLKSITPHLNEALKKFPSGSDERKAISAFITGIDANGKARWAPGGDLASDAEFFQKYFQDNTIEFVETRTSNGVLTLPDDILPSLVYHFANAYQERDPSELDTKAQDKRRRYFDELADIQTRYGELEPEEAERRRAEDLTKLQQDMAGEEMRRRLNNVHTLGQIYRTRGSGAANNAPTLLRHLLGLDDEAIVAEYLRQEYRQNGGNQRKGKGGPSSSSDDPAPTPPPTPDTPTPLTDVTFDEYTDQIRLLAQNYPAGSLDTEEFFQQSLDILSGLHGLESRIRQDYIAHHRDYRHETIAELSNYLIGLINNKDNY